MASKNSENRVEEIVVALFDYTKVCEEELSIKENERLTLVDSSSQWWKVRNANGFEGYVPRNYVKLVPQKHGLFSGLLSTLGRKKSSSSTTERKAATLDYSRNGKSDHMVDSLNKSINDSLHINTNSTSKGHTLYDSMSEGLKSTEQLPSGGPAGIGAKQAQNGSGTTFPLYSSTGQLLQAGDSTGANALLPASGNMVCQARHTYAAAQDDELSITRGDRIEVLEQSSDGWWRGYVLGLDNTRTRLGWFPSNYVIVDSKAPWSSTAPRPGQATGSLNRPAMTAGSNMSLGANHVKDRARLDAREGGQRSQSVLGQYAQNAYRTGPQVSGVRPVADFDAQHPSNGGLPPLAAGNVVPLQPYYQSAYPAAKPAALTTIHNNNHHRPQPPPMHPLMGQESWPPPGAETVLTMFAFKKNQEEEMSFSANETLMVLDKPADDPEWWKCRDRYGNEGLVPRNYVRLLNTPARVSGEQLRLVHARKTKAGQQHINQPWYWGGISRADCENMLHHYGMPGDFVVRDSESHPGDLTVTMMAGTKNRNFKVQVEESQYNIGQKMFQSLDDLIRHYQDHPIYKNETERHFLGRAFQHPGNS